MRLSVEDLKDLPLGQALWLHDYRHQKCGPKKATLNQHRDALSIALAIENSAGEIDILIWSLRRNGPMRSGGAPVNYDRIWLELRD